MRRWPLTSSSDIRKDAQAICALKETDGMGDGCTVVKGAFKLRGPPVTAKLTSRESLSRVVTHPTLRSLLVQTLYCSTQEPIMGSDGLQDIMTESAASECGGSTTV